MTNRVQAANSTIVARSLRLTFRRVRTSGLRKSTESSRVAGCGRFRSLGRRPLGLLPNNRSVLSDNLAASFVVKQRDRQSSPDRRIDVPDPPIVVEFFEPETRRVTRTQRPALTGRANDRLVPESASASTCSKSSHCLV
jgi:hypothetical protein